jgi:coenzyme F420-reducing hydrogenase alpha subunit
MSYLKKAWLTDQSSRGASLYALSLESEQPEDHNKLKIREMMHPANPTPEHPLHHVIITSFLDQDDINKLAKELDKYRTDK